MVKKCVWILVFVLIIIALLPKIYYKSVKAEKMGAQYLAELGWEVGKLCESEKFKIPSPLNDVYKKYNELQQKSGFNLENYCGRDVVRLTYEIKNHKNADNVFANVIICDGEVIAGDIMTREIDGFMHEITGKEYIK